MANKIRNPQDPEQKNGDRSDWARQAIEEFMRVTHMQNEHIETGLTDLLADIAHFCDREQIDFGKCMNNACGYYEEETGNDGQQFERISILPLVANYILPSL